MTQRPAAQPSSVIAHASLAHTRAHTLRSTQYPHTQHTQYVPSRQADPTVEVRAFTLSYFPLGHHAISQADEPGHGPGALEGSHRGGDATLILLDRTAPPLTVLSCVHTMDLRCHVQTSPIPPGTSKGWACIEHLSVAAFSFPSLQHVLGAALTPFVGQH